MIDVPGNWECIYTSHYNNDNCDKCKMQSNLLYFFFFTKFESYNQIHYNVFGYVWTVQTILSVLSD